MDKEVRTVTNITELILALYDQVPTLKVTGSLANNLYYASRNLRLIGITIVVLFTALFSALYRPNLMVPVVIICLALLGLFSLPIIFLFIAQVSLRTLSKVRRNYRVQSFNGGSQELIYSLRSGEPTTAQGERNLRSLRLVLPLHHKFKFRHHATHESPLSSLEAAAAASPAVTPEAAPPDLADATAPTVAPKAKPKRAPKSKAVAQTGDKTEPVAASPAESKPATKTTAKAAAKSTAQAPESSEPQVLTRVINRRKKTKPAASANAAQ